MGGAGTAGAPAPPTPAELRRAQAFRGAAASGFDRLPVTVAIEPGPVGRILERLAWALAALAAAPGLWTLAAGDATGEPPQAVWAGLGFATILVVFAVHARRERARSPERLSVTLDGAEVAVETDRGRWTWPLSDYRGLRLRAHVTVPHRAGTRGRAVTLRWIELDHADPERRLPLWASDARDAEAAGRAALRDLRRLLAR